MARVARKRYVIKKNYRINSVSLEGIRVILLGECSRTGKLKPKYKHEKTAYRFRFEDKKDPKQLGIPGDDLVCSKDYLNLFFEEAEA